MGFWNIMSRHGDAVVTPERTYSYAELAQSVADAARLWKDGSKRLVLVLCDQSYGMLAAYLAALNAGHAVMLLNADLEERLLADIVETYQPAWIYGSRSWTEYEETGSSLWRRKRDAGMVIHPDLAVLLSTSGTTGSKKFVRLSYANIESNARAIVEYLQITADERGMANLPMSYSYGFSIVNSHLAAGAVLLLTRHSVLEKPFWSFLQEGRASSFAGVPYTYQMLQRIGFHRMELPHVRYFTQAGGHLDVNIARSFAEYAAHHGKRFYVMYGQTEASPRMSYIPPDRLPDKLGSIGVPIPGGRMDIDAETGELVYQGPNVMMGYAESPADLAKGDLLKGVLHTGDTAAVDEDGFFRITGRLSRFVKLFGLRVNLDEVERRLQSEIGAAVACAGDDRRMIVVLETEESVPVVKNILDSSYRLHPSAYRIQVVNAIPRLDNGKTNYTAIKDGLL